MSRGGYSGIAYANFKAHKFSYLRWLERVLVFSMHYIWELKYLG